MGGDLFGLLLELNLALGGAILLVLLLRRPVRRLFGARHAYALWAVAPLAMLAILLPGPIQLVAVRTPAPTYDAQPAIRPSPPAPPAVRAVLRQLPDGSDIRDSLLILWAAGALVALAIQAGRQARFVGALGRLRPDPGGAAGLFHAEHADVGPAVVGALAPRIVLPADFDRRFTPEERAVIVAHERAHLATGDAQINAVAALMRCLCWFNPLVHIAAARLRIDQEIACDAAVLARFPGQRRRYGEVMLKTQLVPAAPPLGCHWPAGAQRHLKERIGMLKFDRPTAARRRLGGLALAVIGLGMAAGAWSAQPARQIEVPRAAPASKGDPKLARPLFDAVRAGDPARIEQLVKAGAQIDRRFSGDGTALIEAARTRQVYTVKLLLEHGADPNLASHGDGNPLIMAAANGEWEIVRLLVEAGADVNAFVVDDETPLINAARGGQVSVVAYLVDHGADVNLAVKAGSQPPQSLQIRSPLSEAARFERTEVVDYLRSKGAKS